MAAADGASEQVLAQLEKGQGLSALSAQAFRRTRAGLLHTNLLQSAWLTRSTNSRCCWLKLESEQHTGSFKARGALNKLLCLSTEELSRGVITSSTGNHALGVMYACRYLLELQMRQHKAGVPPQPLVPQVFVPCTTSAFKLQRLLDQGAKVLQVGQDCVESELAAVAAAREAGAVYISPYNDMEVMAGQGTVGIEMLQDVMGQEGGAPPDVVFVPVGGGGLIAGIAAVLKAWSPAIQVVGCQPAASAVMAASVQAGRILDLPSLPTLSDATAGGIEPDALTLGPCTQYVDQWVCVEEDEIRAAIRSILEQHCKLIEGAAGVAVAACLKLGAAGALAGKRVVVLVCGGNMAMSTLKQVLQ